MSINRFGFSVLLLLAVAGLAMLAWPSMQDAMAGNEWKVRRAVINQMADWFTRVSGVAIDDTLDRYEKEQARTPSGLWRTNLAFTGFDEGSGPRGDEAGWKSAESQARYWVRLRRDSPYAPVYVAQVIREHAENNCNCVFLPVSAYPELARARGVLLQTKNRHVPEWQYEMLLLAIREKQDPYNIRNAYEAARKQAPGFYPLHFAMVDYLLQTPGDAGIRAVEVLARKVSADENAPDRGALYARMLWYAAQVRGDAQVFTPNKVDWPKLDASFQEVMRSYPDAWNRNHYAKYACLLGHPERSERLMRFRRRLMEAWDSWEQFDRCTG